MFVGMKNEDRILELMTEALQRIDRHSEQFDRVQNELQRMSEKFDQQQQEYRQQQEEYRRQWQEEQERWQEQLQVNRLLLNKVQRHDDRLDDHRDALSALRERTEVIHQSSLEQVNTYRELTQLVITHHRALLDRNIL